jgi:hypothetical protein
MGDVFLSPWAASALQMETSQSVKMGKVLARWFSKVILIRAHQVLYLRFVVLATKAK